MPCNKALLKTQITTTNTFIKNNCINKSCRYLNSITVTSELNNETIFTCLKHNQSILGMLNSNPNMICNV
jgi:hypothetical protein